MNHGEGEETFHVRTPANMLPRRLISPRVESVPTTALTAQSAGAAIPFPDRPYPCDLDYHRGDFYLVNDGRAPLSLVDDTAVTGPPRWNAQNVWTVVCTVTIPGGFIAYCLDSVFSVQDQAWSNAIDWALRMGPAAVIDPQYHGMPNSPHHLPLMGRARGKTTLALCARVQDAYIRTGTDPIRDRLMAYGRLAVTCYSEQPRCEGGVMK